MKIILKSNHNHTPKYIYNHTCSLTDHVLSLIFNSHEFEFLQGHQRLTWWLTLGLVRLVEVCANWYEHQC